MSKSTTLSERFEVPYDVDGEQYIAKVRVVAGPDHDAPDVAIVATEDPQGMVTVAEHVRVTGDQWDAIERDARQQFLRWADQYQTMLDDPSYDPHHI